MVNQSQNLSSVLACALLRISASTLKHLQT